jgi:hypothetical protein
MIIQTTTSFDDLLTAQDSLEGLKALPGFIFGYLLLPNTAHQKHDVVTIFKCSGDTLVQRQRRVNDIRSQPLHRQ